LLERKNSTISTQGEKHFVPPMLLLYMYLLSKRHTQGSFIYGLINTIFFSVHLKGPHLFLKETIPVPVRVWITFPESLSNLIPTKTEHRRAFEVLHHVSWIVFKTLTTQVALKQKCNK
jgi:hypothetical protein